MENVTVRSIMTRRVATIGIDQSVVDASQTMERDHVNCLVVMGGRSAVGMSTDSDITRYVVSKGPNPKKTLRSSWKSWDCLGSYNRISFCY